MIYNLGVAQSTPKLISPKHLNDVIKLNTATSSYKTGESLDYDYLAVFVEDKAKKYDSNNAIQGKYTKENNYLVFKPYFPFENGMTYNIRTKGDIFDGYSYQTFKIGEKKIVENAKVVNIYPSATELPENLLRFYLYFNTPMKKGNALKYIQLIDFDGVVDNHVFMEFKQELWSSDGKRLTVLFDPGRIKRGVSTNKLRGPALLEGNQYYLRILSTWQDVYGQPLETITKEIKVVKAYRSKIKVNEWGLDKPKPNTSKALTVHFNRIMDHALIQSMIQLKDEKANQVAGYWEILEHQKQIQFIPEEKWNKGTYKIIIDTRLEDVAGNNLQNLLDHNKNDEDNKGANQFIDFKI